MSITYQQIKNETLGKKFDLDNFPLNQPYQCWDYVMWVLNKYYGGSVIPCTQTGYVKDIANLRKTNGILKYCDDVGLYTELKPGDICVWGNCPACPLSHIALYDSDNGPNEVYFLGQNQCGGYVCVHRFDVSGIIGVFRPKALYQNTGDADVNYKMVNGYKVELENGTATFTNAIPINVRRGGPKGEIVAQYNKGQSVKYWGKYVGNGHRYVVYTGSSGYTNFVAVSGSEVYGKDKWAVCK